MRILVGPIEIAGIASGLKDGFDQLGIDCEVVLSCPHRFAYGRESESAVARLWATLGGFHSDLSARHLRPMRVLTLAVWKTWSMVVLIWALLRFDSFIFLFGRTITDSAVEARLYALLGKRVVMFYCGSDVRPPYVDGPTCNHYGVEKVRRIARIARRTRARIWLHERCGFVCVNSPFTGQFHARSFVNSFEMGIPRRCGDEMPEALPAEARPGNATVRIFHSPSDAAAKGTAVIIDIVERLKRDGHAIELVMLQGATNEQVQAELRRCDFVIDQCWSDSPMAGFATEAAHHAKAAVVAGYPAGEDYRRYFSAVRPPTTYVHPDDLEIAIARLVVDPERRRELGRQAFEFVRQNWSVEKVAGRFLDLLEGRALPSQFASPGSPPYVLGSGLPEERAREMVRALISQRGPSGLYLDHHPALERAFVEFAAARPGPVP